VQKRFDYGRYATNELTEWVGGAQIDSKSLGRARAILDRAERHARDRGLERVDALATVLHDYALAAAVVNNGDRLSAGLGVLPQTARIRLLALALS
jgi:hypothetical protein